MSYLISWRMLLLMTYIRGISREIFILFLHENIYFVVLIRIASVR